LANEALSAARKDLTRILRCQVCSCGFQYFSQEQETDNEVVLHQVEAESCGVMRNQDGRFEPETEVLGWGRGTKKKESLVGSQLEAYLVTQLAISRLLPT
jgi:hypothetical protein